MSIDLDINTSMTLLSKFGDSFAALHRNGSKDVTIGDALTLATCMIQDVGGEIDRMSPDTGNGARIEFTVPQDGVIGPTGTVTFTSDGDRTNFLKLVGLVRHLNQFVAAKLVA